MPSKTYLILDNIKINYFNILYALIMPAFIVGQFIFKSIFILIIISALIRFKFKVFYFNKNFINLLFIITILFIPKSARLNFSALIIASLALTNTHIISGNSLRDIHYRLYSIEWLCSFYIVSNLIGYISSKINTKKIK